VILVVQATGSMPISFVHQTHERLCRLVLALDSAIDRVINLLYSALDFQQTYALRLKDNAWWPATGKAPRRGPCVRR